MKDKIIRLEKSIDYKVMDDIVEGRVEPHIYAFETNQIPNSIKVGDTNRAVSKRLKEWKLNYPDLVKIYEASAKVDDNTYFRDYSVHQVLENKLHKKPIKKEEIKKGVYYSKEFFRDANKNDVKYAIDTINDSYLSNEQIYDFYKDVNLRVTQSFVRNKDWKLRPNQEEVVSNYIKAVKKGRHNLLMYAVMRFGKSFTALCCAKKNNDKFVVVVSGKADVQIEWKQNVESPLCLDGFIFGDRDTLDNDQKFVENKLKAGNTVVIFLTLQDLLNTSKERFDEIFGRKIDLLIIDETHFGARSKRTGAVLKEVVNPKDNDDYISINDAEESINRTLNAKTKLHLSGTPYRILMGSEFEKEDIISFVQFSDIVKAQKEWNIKNENIDKNEWDNPYFGFPQMIRFAFALNKSAKEKVKELEKNGYSANISTIFETISTKKDETNDYIKFKYENEVLDFLKAIDGVKEDDVIFSFLNYKKIHEGNMCRHIVFVLPYRASCDAMEKVLCDNRNYFVNLSEYTVLNISGFNTPKSLDSTQKVKQTISHLEAQNNKTITLTVNRMLTGSTVREWDCMVFLKDTSSPQEYDQAIYRLQNQYTKTLYASKNQKMIIDLKPQTILVDMEINRMFELQEKRCQIYNANVSINGNNQLEKRLEEELEISPIITINNNEIKKVKAIEIMEQVSNYSRNRGIVEETNDIAIDEKLLDNDSILSIIQKEYPWGSKEGLAINVQESEDGDTDETGLSTVGEEPGTNGTSNGESGENAYEDEREKLIKKFKAYYAKILFYSFLTESIIISLKDLIDSFSDSENKRIAKNVGLNKKTLIEIYKNINRFALSDLDYKIQHLNKLSKDNKLNPLDKAEIAINKFGKLGSAIVITNSEIADEMISYVPEEKFYLSVRDKKPFIDPFSVAGEFAIALYKKFISLGFELKDFKDLIYSYPKNSLCYEFTRKVYKDLNLDIKMINDEFTSFDLMNENKDAFLKTIDGGKSMKFAALVGNPPYQANLEGNKRQPPIYHLFMELAYKISDFSVLITPARFLFDAGQTPKDWNRKMLNDRCFTVNRYISDAETIFPGTLIRGGVAITTRDISQNHEPITFFIADNNLSGIISKVTKTTEHYLSEIVYPKSSCHLSDKLYVKYPKLKSRLTEGNENIVDAKIFKKMPEIFSEKKGDIKVYGKEKQRTCKYINQRFVEMNDVAKNYKVIIAGVNGGGQFGETLSSPFVGEKNSIYTQTFMSIGCFKRKVDAENCLKYIKTKFARCMLGTLKITHNNPREVWSKIPLQDFSSQLKIKWDAPIKEIDKQLYKIYKLSKDEIKYIEDNVQPME